MELSPESTHSALADCGKKKIRKARPGTERAAVALWAEPGMKMQEHPLAVGEDIDCKIWSLQPLLSSPGILSPLSEPLTLVARRLRGSSNGLSLRVARKAGHWVLRGNQNAGSVPTLESFEWLTWLSFHSVGESPRARGQERMGGDMVRAGGALQGHLAQGTRWWAEAMATMCCRTAPRSLGQPEPPGPPP